MNVENADFLAILSAPAPGAASSLCVCSISIEQKLTNQSFHRSNTLV